MVPFTEHSLFKARVASDLPHSLKLYFKFKNILALFKKDLLSFINGIDFAYNKLTLFLDILKSSMVFILVTHCKVINND